MWRIVQRLALVLLVACVGASTVWAAAFRITLSDGTEIVGVIRSFEDGIYRVMTSGGEQAIDASEVQGLVPVVIDLQPSPQPTTSDAALLPTPEFTILTGDSKIIVGRLVAFEDGVYEIETRSGRVRVPIAQVSKIDIAWIQSPQPGASVVTLTPGALRLSGANAMAEGLAPVLVEAFAASGGAKDMVWSRGQSTTLRSFSATAKGDGKFSVNLRNRNSADAPDALLRDEADIAMMSRRMLPEEAQKIAAGGFGSPLSIEQEHVVAPGGVVVLVHPSNPVKMIWIDQLAQIFAGQIRDWSEVGGPRRRIQVFLPADGSGILESFQSRVFGGQKAIATAKRVASSQELSEILASDPAAIGIADYSHIGNARALAITDECGASYEPSQAALRSEDYPLSTRHYLYTAQQVKPLPREFIAYALSSAGQRSLSDKGFANFLPMLAPRDASAFNVALPPAKTPAEQRAVAEVPRLLEAASRLSVVFRFDESDQALDARGERDVKRLADYLRAEKGPRRRLVLVGFSDPTGPFDSNVKVSEKRARLVAQRLKQEGITADRVTGLGPLLPIVCGASAEALGKNRRVEAWLY